jgi:hypothetical protein
MKEENCNEASEMNREANTVNDEAKIKIAETTTLIEDLKVKLSELAGLVDDQTIKQKRTELNNKITESNSNIVMATEKLEEADEMFEVFKPRYDEFKESGDRELAIDFTNNVDELRHTQDSAKDLEANVDKLLEDVKSWHSKLKDLMDSYDKVKNEVETSTVSNFFRPFRKYLSISKRSVIYQSKRFSFLILNIFLAKLEQSETAGGKCAQKHLPETVQSRTMRKLSPLLRVPLHLNYLQKQKPQTRNTVNYSLLSLSSTTWSACTGLSISNIVYLNLRELFIVKDGLLPSLLK